MKHTINPVDSEMTKRIIDIQNKHAGKTVWLPPSIHVQSGRRIIHTRWWYRHAGFEEVDTNRWKIPKE